MSADRIIRFARKAPLLAASGMALLSACDKDPKHFTVTPTTTSASQIENRPQIAPNNNILLVSEKSDISELDAFERAKAAEAHAKGEGIVFLYASNPKSLNVSIVLQKMEGKTPISKQTGTMQLDNPPLQDFFYVTWFNTSDCTSSYQLAYRPNGDKDFRGIKVDSSPIFSFDRNCAISLNVTEIVNPVKP